MNEELIYRYIGAKIRQRRVEQNLSQEELGAGVGMTRASITNIEVAKQRVQIHTLYAIAEKLGVEATFFFPTRQHLGAWLVPVTINGTEVHLPPEKAKAISAIAGVEISRKP